MKIIINEIQINKKNYFNSYGDDFIPTKSGVYSNAAPLKQGNSWIKQSNSEKGYSKKELQIFELQATRPDIFAKTKIINGKIIKTEYIDILKNKVYYWNELKVRLRLVYKQNYIMFNEFFDDAVDYYSTDKIFKIKMIESYNKEISENKDNKNYYLSLLDHKRFFIDLLSLCRKLKTFIDENYDLITNGLLFYGSNKYGFLDIHLENIGYDKNKRLKVLDWTIVQE